MWHSYRIDLFFVLIAFTACQAQAMSSVSDGDLIVTLQSGHPCYLYPNDEKTKQEPYFLGNLGVSDLLRISRHPVIWEMQSGEDGEDFYSPSSPQTCLEYGVLESRMEEKASALPHRFDVPYRASLTVFAGYSVRSYRAAYCLSHDPSGAVILQKANYSNRADGFVCIPKAVPQ